MRHVGGEHELQRPDYYQSVTACGRDALRLIIESGNLQGRNFLLPDFLCNVIIDTLDEYQITYRFYKVRNDLSCELNKVNDNDVIYYIKYFGKKDIVEVSKFKENIVIVDDVFSVFPETLDTFKSWYSFNSLRKISPLADGSIVYSNNILADGLIRQIVSSEFSKKKYTAKADKFDFLNRGIGSEGRYLSAFQEAEKMLDGQNGILGMSARSQIEFALFCEKMCEERRVRAMHYDLIRRALPPYAIEFESPFYSFAPILLPYRDAIRRKLMENNIFLAVHWPSSSTISTRILSIPLDSRYTSSQLERVCALINLLVQSESA